MWGQVVTRAQLPFFIGMKNSFTCFRHQSGYGFFVDVFFWLLLISMGLLAVLIAVGSQLTFTGLVLVSIIFSVLFGTFLYHLGYSRSVFKEK
jgi:hypothetical protein